SRPDAQRRSRRGSTAQDPSAPDPERGAQDDRRKPAGQEDERRRAGHRREEEPDEIDAADDAHRREPVREGPRGARAQAEDEPPDAGQPEGREAPRISR